MLREKTSNLEKENSIAKNEVNDLTNLYEEQQRINSRLSEANKEFSQNENEFTRRINELYNKLYEL